MRGTGPPIGLLCPWVTEELLLTVLLAEEYDGSLWYLFDGDYTPSLGDTTSSVLPHQVTWPGISNPSADSWGTPSIGTDSHAVSVGPPLAWTFNAADGDRTIGGAFALDVNGNLLGAELIITGPVILTTTGQVLPYIPVVSLGAGCVLLGDDT